jgi:hypothetical protein
MNKLVIAIALCAALAACKKEDAAPAADATAPAAPAADAAAPAADPAAAPAADVNAPAIASGSGLPKECEDYINRAKACFAKANPVAAAAFQKSLDESKANWLATTDKTTLAQQCTEANTQFAQAAAAMKCE